MEMKTNEYVSFRLDIDNELVNEKGDVMSGSRKNFNVDATDTKSFDAKTIVNKFQEFMVQVGRDKDLFDFGGATLWDVIMYWHVQNEPDLTGSAEDTDEIDFCGMKLDPKSKKKIKDGMFELADHFQEILEQFQNQMNKKQK